MPQDDAPTPSSQPSQLGTTPLTKQAHAQLTEGGRDYIRQILADVLVTSYLPELQGHEPLQQQWQTYLASEVHLSVHPSKPRLIMHVPSAQLNIEQKAALERAIRNHPKHPQLTALAEAHGLKLQLNFTKTATAPPPGKPAPAASHQPHLDQPSPFMVTETPRRPLPGIGAIYCVASGKGGVGKSTIAAHIARLLATMECNVGLLDADIHGPSAPELLGLKGSLQVRPDHKVIPMKNHGVHCVSFGFLSDSHHPAMWRGPLISKALEQFIFDVAWGELDVLIIDLPPGTGDIPMTMAESVAIDGALIVTTAHPIALIDAHKAISMFHKLAIPLVGVLGNMIYLNCEDCSHRNHVFGEAASLRQMCMQRSVPLLGELPLLMSTEDPLQLATTAKSTPNHVYVHTLKQICYGLAHPDLLSPSSPDLAQSSPDQANTVSAH